MLHDIRNYKRKVKLKYQHVSHPTVYSTLSCILFRSLEGSAESTKSRIRCTDSWFYGLFYVNLSLFACDSLQICCQIELLKPITC